MTTDSKELTLPKHWSVERGETFLDGIRKGKSVREMSESLGLDVTCPYDWMKNEGCMVGGEPFASAYIRARVVDADRIADEVGRLAVKAEAMADDRQSRPDGLRVAMQGLQWLASVRNPSRYNPRVLEAQAMGTDGSIPTFQVNIQVNGGSVSTNIEEKVKEQGK